MSRIGFACSCLVASMFLVVASAYAENPFEQLGKLGAWSAAKNMANKHEMNPNAAFRSSPQQLKASRDPDIFCGDDWKCHEAVGDAGNLLELKKSQMSQTLTTYGPLSGLSDTMFSKVHADQMSTVLSSPMVLYNVTMLLTEPAVAGGVQNAMMQGLGSVQNRYLAEDLFLSKLDRNPETAPLLKGAYEECVATYLRIGASWPEAQSKCMADRVKSSDIKFEQLSNDGFDTGIGFDFQYDPNHPHALDGTLNDLNKIRLSDLLFSQANNQLANMNADDKKEVKIKFQEIFGDYIFTIDPVKNPGSDTQQGNTPAARRLIYSRENPVRNMQELYDETTENAYNGILMLLKQKCEFPTNDSTPFSEANLFCRGDVGGGDAAYVDISVVGYQFDCAMMDMLIEKFKKDFFRQIAVGTPGGCSPLDPTGVSKLQDLKDSPKNARDSQRAVYQLASKVALGQVYSFIMFSQFIVQNVSSTEAVNSHIKVLADQIVNSTVGVAELNAMAELAQVVNSIQEFKASMTKDRTKQSGRSATKIVDVMSQSKEKAATRAANPTGR